jgi:HSP20 family protein
LGGFPRRLDSTGNTANRKTERLFFNDYYISTEEITMKNQTFIAIAVILLFILSLQTYMMFQLNEKLDQLNPAVTETDTARSAPPQMDLNEDLFKDQPWTPYEEIQRMQNAIEGIFEDSFSRFHLNAPAGSLHKSPDVDLQEKPDAYIVTMNVPGADESTLKVELEDQRLHITMRTERAKEEKTENDKEGQYRHQERFIGEFQRVLTLPGPADASKMKTDYTKGVLTITIPKK